MANTEDINMELLYFVRLSNIDNLYNYYDNLIRSMEGNYNFNDGTIDKDKEDYRKECLNLSRLRNETIQEMNKFYKNKA